MNVGILFPASTAHPNVGLDFMNGLRAYLKEHNISEQVNFFSESIGIGGSEKEVYEKAEKLVMMDDVDMLLAYVDERVLDMLKPLLHATGKLMIVINPGANYPLNWLPQDNIIHLTLQQAFCCWQTGKLAAQEENKTAATASTFYDCGYLHSAAMVKHFANAGGSVNFNYINNDKYDDSFGVTPLTGHINGSHEAVNLLCTFDTLPASLLYGLLKKDATTEKIKLFVSPMMLEKEALESNGGDFPFSISGYTSWLAGAPHAGNATFGDAYTKKSRSATSIFAVLGWEAGMLLEAVVKKGGADVTNGAALVDMIRSEQFESPRGTLRLDPETHYFLGALALCTLPAHGNELQTTWSDDYEADWKAFTEEKTGGSISGWTNTYLCY